ncbi:MAG TPA: class I SAM-dependent methyltransferase, partial [Phycisphaerales bacterium]|nr:class I SAM-dependent methyltransferase [Phycisphaerales bacterium]
IHDLKSTLGIGAFDVATFWATIEHLPDPVGMLRDIHDMLRPGGVLLLDTGIGDDWLDRLLPGRVQWYAPPQHLFVFSGSGFARSVEQAGFQVVHHDRCFDRSRRRRMIRMVRNGVTAALLRAASEIGRLKPGPFAFTRFPLGNLQSIVARKV